MVCKYYLPRDVCRVYVWLGCRVTERKREREASDTRRETRKGDGGRGRRNEKERENGSVRKGRTGERRWNGVRANSLSFYPILKSECLAPLTLETGCGGRTPQRTTTPHRFPGLLLFYPLSLHLHLPLSLPVLLFLSFSLLDSCLAAFHVLYNLIPSPSQTCPYQPFSRAHQLTWAARSGADLATWDFG